MVTNALARRNQLQTFWHDNQQLIHKWIEIAMVVFVSYVALKAVVYIALALPVLMPVGALAALILSVFQVGITVALIVIGLIAVLGLIGMGTAALYRFSKTHLSTR